MQDLRQLITSGELPPGARLSEDTLASSFDVSRTPVREALKQLQVEGLIEIIPRVGTFVAQPSTKEIEELFIVKQVLEGLAARLVARTKPEEVLAQLRLNMKDSEAAMETGEEDLYASLIDAFHQLIVAGAENSKLLAHYQLLVNQLAYDRLVRDAMDNPDKMKRALTVHRRILRLIERGEEDGAETAMREHGHGAEVAMQQRVAATRRRPSARRAPAPVATAS